MNGNNIPRICFYPGALNLGGVGRLTINLAAEMLAQGYKVDIFLTKYQGDYLDNIPKEVTLIKGKGGAIKSILAFAKYITKHKPDVIISSRDYLNFINIMVTKLVRSKTQVITSVHVDYSGMPEQKQTLRLKMLTYALKKLYPRADNIVAVSGGVAKDFSHRFGYPYEEIDVIYNPTYQEENYNKESKLEYQAFYETDLPIIIGVGRLNDQKNFSLLIESFEQVNKERKSKLIILGEGPNRKELENLIIDKNLQDQILLAGFVPNPIDYIKKSDVFVMSSSWEGFGNVIVEAMGTGISIVATDCPSGPAEILNDPKCGKLVPIHNKDEMSKAILELLKNPLKSNNVIARAKDFSVPTITSQYVKLIKNIGTFQSAFL